MRSVMLMVIPLLFMFFASIVSFTSQADKKYQMAIQTGSYEINQKSGELTSSVIDFGWLTLIIVIVSAFIALAVVASVHVFGSGVGEFGVKTIVIGGICLAVWGFLSAVSWGVIANMPLFGMFLYFVLSVCYVVGLVGVLGGNQ